MPTSLSEFKQAFAGKTTDDDLAAHDKTFARALKRLDQSIEGLGGAASAGGFQKVRDKLADRYRDVRKKPGLSNKEVAEQLDEVISQAEAAIVKVNAAPQDGGWSISPDGSPVQASPTFPGAGGGLPKLDPKFIEQLMEEDRKKQEKRLKEAQDALEKARKWLVGLPKDELRKLSYPAILATIKDKFPAVSDLPKPKQLMDMVDVVLRDSGYLLEKGLLGDASRLAMEKIIAAYIAALPGNIKATVSDGGITLIMAGAASMPAVGGADAKPGAAKGEKFEFKNKNYTIQVANEAWKALDPSMRAKWKGLNDEAGSLDKIKAALTSLKKEWESEKGGTSRKIELEAKIKDLEAEFKGRWETLQQSITATAKLTTDGIKATLEEAKKKSKDEKAGAELELKFEEMSVGLKAFARTPDLKTALAVTGSAEKITARIEAEAIKSGTVVTLNYEKALKEVKEQIQLQLKHGNAAVAATLSKDAVKLEERLKQLNDAKTKDFKDVKALEEGLEKLKLEVTAEFKSGNFKISGGGKVASDGEAGGKVKVELMLEQGISFLGPGQKVSFSADVSNKGYQFALMFSVGEMPDLSDVHKANKEADEKIRKLYEMVKDAKIRSMDDASRIKDAFSEVMKPLKASVDSMKKVDKKKYAVELGLTLTGELPSGGGRMPPPVAGFGLKVTF